MLSISTHERFASVQDRRVIVSNVVFLCSLNVQEFSVSEVLRGGEAALRRIITPSSSFSSSGAKVNQRSGPKGSSNGIHCQ